MFDEALARTEIEIGSKNEEDFNRFIQNKSKIEIEELAVGILDKMQPAVNFLIDTINNVFGPEIYGLSKIESIYSPELTPEICKIRIRPNNDYFIKHHKEIPHPDNQNGPDACGVEIFIVFSILYGSCLGYLNNKKHLDKILSYFIKFKTI